MQFEAIMEVQNHLFEDYCDKYDIEHTFFDPRTTQQNGVMVCKSITLEELTRTMTNETSQPKYFWVDAISTTCYVLNRILIRPMLNKTPYELLKGRKPNLSHLHVFGCKCFKRIFLFIFNILLCIHTTITHNHSCWVLSRLD